MLSKDFNSLLKIKHEEEEKLLSSKGQEYTIGDSDRLIAFKEIAKQIGITPKQVCMVFMTKHFFSLCNYVSGQASPTTEQLSDRVTDLRNYALFLEALDEDEDA